MLDQTYAQSPLVSREEVARQIRELVTAWHDLPGTESDSLVIDSPASAAQVLMPLLMGEEQEKFIVLLLNQKHRAIRVVHLYRGCLNAINIRPAEVFREAVRDNAASIIVVHNYPSGDPTPSKEDIAVTQALVKVGFLLDIPVVDHIVVGANRCESLRSQFLGFDR